jgi:hypothetical protein
MLCVLSGYSDQCKSCCVKNTKKCRDKRLIRTPEQVVEDRILKFDGKSTKQCIDCGCDKEFSCFGEDMASRCGLQSVCIDCKYKRDLDVLVRNRAFMSSLKEGCCCEECGFEDTRCLEFAHYNREDKSRTTDGVPIQPAHMRQDKLLAELEYTRFLCKICHARETMEEIQESYSNNPVAVNERKRVAGRRELVNIEKDWRGECLDCGLGVTSDLYFIFDFDHRDGAEKVERLSQMVLQRWSEQEICDEMDKCDLRCKNCHWIRTLECGQIGRSKLHSSASSSSASSSSASSSSASSSSASSSSIPAPQHPAPLFHVDVSKSYQIQNAVLNPSLKFLQL